MKCIICKGKQVAWGGVGWGMEIMTKEVEFCQKKFLKSMLITKWYESAKTPKTAKWKLQIT